MVMIESMSERDRAPAIAACRPVPGDGPPAIVGIVVAAVHGRIVTFRAWSYIVPSAMRAVFETITSQVR